LLRTRASDTEDDVAEVEQDDVTEGGEEGETGWDLDLRISKSRTSVFLARCVSHN
jgi:hypothetical protein